MVILWGAKCFSAPFIVAVFLKCFAAVFFEMLCGGFFEMLCGGFLKCFAAGGTKIGFAHLVRACGGD